MGKGKAHASESSSAAALSSSLSDSGLGFSGTSAVSSASTPMAGTVILSPLDTPHDNGTVNVLMPYRVAMSDGTPAPCSATFSSGGTATWTGGILTADLFGGATPYLRIN